MSVVTKLGATLADLNVAVPVLLAGPVAVIVEVPFATAVTRPVLEFTVAAAALLLVHANVMPLIALPFGSLPLAVKRTVSPVPMSESTLLGVTTTCVNVVICRAALGVLRFPYGSTAATRT